MESTALHMQSRDLMIGKICALTFVILMIALAAYSIYAGYPYLAGLLGSGVLASVVWAFVSVTGEQPGTSREENRVKKSS